MASDAALMVTPLISSGAIKGINTTVPIIINGTKAPAKPMSPRAFPTICWRNGAQGARLQRSTTVEISKIVTLGAHYTLGIGGDVAMNAQANYPGQGRVQGTYDNTFIHFAAVSVGLKYGKNMDVEAKKEN